MKNILVYSFTFFPNLGGLERNSYTICNTLQTLGYKVTLLTKTRKQNIESKNYNFKLIRSINIFTYFKAIYNADLIIINGGIAKPVALIAFLLGKKYMPLYQNAELSFLKNESFTNKLSKYLFNKAYYHICLSEYTRLQTKKKNSLVILNPIDTELEIFATESEIVITAEYDCLFVGRIIEGKGIFILVNAIKFIEKKYGITLAVAFVGDGNDILKLEEQLLNNEINYRLLGRLNGKALVDVYKSSKLVIIPSTTHIEGNPLVLAEAVSCGTPVIVSNQQAMVETIEGAGLSFESGNFEELAEKIHKALSSVTLYQHLKDSCSAVKDKFSMNRYKKNFKALLSKQY